MNPDERRERSGPARMLRRSSAGRGFAHGSLGERPLVSVVLPVRDGAAGLDAALESLRAQTWKHLEVLVIDDHSRDASPEIARKWQRRDRRFRLESAADPPGGIVHALQRGLARARGELIARMDADDACHPDRIAAQVDLLKRSPELAGCGAGVRLTPRSATSPRAAEYAAWINSMTTWRAVRSDLFVECPLAHPTFMFRAEALAEAGGYRDCGWPEDYDLLLRLWRRGRRFRAADRVLLNWRQGGGRLSRTHPAYSLAAFRACRVHHLRRSLLRDRDGVVVWGAGPTGKLLSRELARQGVRVRAFVEVDARKIGQVIHGAPVCAVPEAGGFAGALHVGAVARTAGRSAVRAAAARAGLAEMTDFVAMA